MSRKFSSSFITYSRYGSKRSCELIYADSKSSVWRMTCSDFHFFKGSCSPKNERMLESIDFDGGPSFYLNDDFFSYGKIVQFLPIGTNNSIEVIIICANPAT